MHNEGIWVPDMSNVPKHYPNMQKVSLRYVALLTFLEINVVVKPRQNP